jgi:hypothetical protein
MKSQISKMFSTVIDDMKTTIFSQTFLNNARQRSQDFTRKRNMPFADLMNMILAQFKCSTQCALERYFVMKGDEKTFMTQQSFSDARQKIKWEAFRLLVDNSVSLLYSGRFPWNTWHGYAVFAVDGSKKQLPSDPKLLDVFGGTGAGATAPTAQASYLYDVLNDIIVDAHLAPLSTDERTLAKRHLTRLQELPALKKKLILFDRGYPSADMITSVREAGCDFLFRVRSKFHTGLDSLPIGVHDFDFIDENGETLSLTAVKLTLDSGETETLLTSLKDKRMGIKAFKDLYFSRWGVETKIAELKHKIEIENFSGRLENNLYQDFFASVQLLNLVSVAARDAQPIIDFSTSDANKYRYKVNKNHAVGVFKDHFIAAVLEPNKRKRDRQLDRVVYLFAKGKTPVRPGRSIPRNPNPRKANFYHNRKSNA